MQWLALIAGIGLTSWQIVDIWRGRQARHWPVALGRVVANTVEKKAARHTRYVAEVEYRYDVGGTTYTGRRLHFGGHRLHRTAEAAEAELRGVEPGAAVMVHYNPQRPDDAALRADVPLGDFWMLLLGIAFLAVGIAK